MPNQNTKISNWVESQQLEITEMYKLGISAATIAKTIGCSRSPIDRFLIEWGLKPVLDTTTSQVKFNTDVFQNMTEESYYWLGFIQGDGCVYKNRFELGLKAEDKKHIEKFADFISCPTPIKFRPKTNSYRLSFGHKNL